MPEKSMVWYFPILILMVYLTAACTNQPAELPEHGITPRDRTGVTELDNVIAIVMGGRRNELQSILGFTQTECTLAEGLGGPPKCLEGEADGTPVEVLPFLGPEGHFIREEDIDTWEGLNLSELFAAYQVSESAYSDENYPAGDYCRNRTRGINYIIVQGEESFLCQRLRD